MRAIDALGREVIVPRAPRRIVSLVPSETESIAALAGLDRLVGRTDYCEEPAFAIERIASVGGTKKVAVDRVIALAPDLVFANQEENGRRDVEALIAHGLTIHVSFPQTVRAAIDHLETIARLLHLDPEACPAISGARSALARSERRPLHARVAVPIWKGPWMSFDGRTYASDLLRHAGAENVFADRARRHPLSADLGGAPALGAPAPAHAERDTRYPRFALAELSARAPEIVLLPDEPYRFGDRERVELEALLPEAIVRLTSGKDLFWYGVRTAAAIDRVSAEIEAAITYRSTRPG